MDKQESSLRKFGSVTYQLLTECHPSVAETLNRALREVNIRFGQRLSVDDDVEKSSAPSVTFYIFCLISDGMVYWSRSQSS